MVDSYVGFLTYKDIICPLKSPDQHNGLLLLDVYKAKEERDIVDQT